MKRTKLIGIVLLIISILVFSIGIFLQYNMTFSSTKGFSYTEVDTDNIAMSLNTLSESKILKYRTDDSTITAVEMETAPVSVYIPPRVEVYDGLTLEELAFKLDKNLGNDYIAGKGYVIANLCVEKNVDPYVAVAIILHETGCGSKCSNLARNCNNVGGQKGKPGCNGGSFKKFDTLDEGITGFIDNLSRNYYSIGLDTVEKIAPKYCEGNTWAGKINYFVEKIRNS